MVKDQRNQRMCWMAAVLGTGLIAWAAMAGAQVGETRAAVHRQLNQPASSPVKDEIERVYDRLDALLAEVVTEERLVRYDLIKDGEWRERLRSLVDDLGRIEIPEARRDKLAFLINAYNVNVLDQVMATGIPDKVINVDGFFKKRPITVGNRRLTLDQLEHERIRPMGDPRIHAALNCAAVSCPDILPRAYRATTLDTDLDNQCRRWINDRSKNRVDENGRLEVSMIFNWFADDFDVEPYGGRIGFMLHFAEDGSEIERALKKMQAGRKGEFRFLEYDWTLNAAPKRDDQ